MNIVYGVSGEGLGHVYEALEVITFLRSEGHAVKVLTFGDRACQALAPFAPTHIEGIHLFFNARGLSLWATARGNTPCLPFFLKHTRRILREVSAFQPDVFLTAYEPFTTFLAHWLKKPLVSMDNQNELRFLPRPPAADAFAFNLVRLATRVVTHGAAAYIVKSFARPAQAPAGVHFVSPLIQREIRALVPTEGPQVLVYLTKPNPDLLAVLRTLPQTFVVYCHNRVGTEGNLIHRAQGPQFLRDLASCQAIIGTTGFSLIADAIYLGKPYFGVPLKRQFEQTHNARYLTESGLGEAAETASRAELAGFLAHLPRYRERLRAYALDPDEQTRTLRMILERVAGTAPAAELAGAIGAAW